MRRIPDRVGGRLILACLFACIGSQTHTITKVAIGPQAYRLRPEGERLQDERPISNLKD